MRKRYVVGLIAGSALLACRSQANAAVIMSDTMTNTLRTGVLAGSTPIISSGAVGTWQAIYTDNAGEIVPSTQTDLTGAGFPTAATTGTLPIDASRSTTGTNFGGYTSHTDDGALIGLNLASTGLITSSATFTFNNTAASGNPTAWGFLGLTTTLTSPDVVANATTVGPWALVRPTSNGTDIVEVYATGGTGHQIATSNVDPGLATHTVQLVFDPSAGTLDAIVDGTDLLSATPYNYGTHGVAIPVADGVIIGDRTNTGLASPSAPSSAVFTNVSVAQAVPEPASLALLSIGGLLLGRRRRV